jgi:hypothetical protein
MNTRDRKQWIRTATLVGVIYFAVGFAFAAFASRATFNLTRESWNRLAFLISAVAFAVHLSYEYFRIRSPALRTAWHTSIAVALGAFGLAVAANIHELSSASGYRPRMLIALIAWPVITAVPAFVVALIVAVGLSLMRRRT